MPLVKSSTHLAICTYLCDKYAKQDTLYPRDLVRRSLVDARLHFDTGVLWARLRYIFEPIFYDGSTDVPMEKIEYLQKCWPIMEAFLERGPYLCGTNMTIADFCCFATVSSIDNVTIDEPEKYPHLMAWIERMSANPLHQTINVEGADIFKKYFGDVVKRGKLLQLANKENK